MLQPTFFHCSRNISLMKIFCYHLMLRQPALQFSILVLFVTLVLAAESRISYLYLAFSIFILSIALVSRSGSAAAAARTSAMYIQQILLIPDRFWRKFIFEWFVQEINPVTCRRIFDDCIVVFLHIAQINLIIIIIIT